jgi:acetyl esterase/lipase
MIKRDASARRLAKHFVELNYSAVLFSSRHSYPEAYQDMFCALAWTRANADAYGFDLERIVVLGDVAAATYAAMLGTVDDPTLYLEGCPHPLPEADWVQGVVAINGLYDFTSDNVGALAKSVIRLFLGGKLSEFPELWSEASPISWLDGSEPPFLLIHALQDPEISASGAENFAAALEGAGVEVELMLVQAGHDFFASSNPASALALDAVDAFLTALFEG